MLKQSSVGLGTRENGCSPILLVREARCSQLYRLAEPERFLTELAARTSTKGTDPFSTGSKAVSAMHDWLARHPKFSDIDVHELTGFLNFHLFGLKSDFMGYFNHSHPSILGSDVLFLPTPDAVLSKTVPIDVVNEVRDRSFVYGHDELKIIVVALLRSFGYPAHLAEFQLNAGSFSREAQFRTVPYYLPTNPYSPLNTNVRIGIAMPISGECKPGGELDHVMTFYPIRVHPDVDGFTILGEEESQGVLFGLLAERRLANLQMRLENAEPDVLSKTPGIVQGIVSDIKEALGFYARNSAALPVLAKLTNLVSGFVENGKLPGEVLTSICDSFGITDWVRDSTGAQPAEVAKLRATLRDTGLIARLACGETALPDTLSAFLLGTCLDDLIPEDGIWRR